MAKRTTTEPQTLRDMRQGWLDTVAKTGGAQFPPGKAHEGIIKDVIIEPSKKGNLQVHWTLLGTSDEIDGMTDHKWSSMATPENRQWLKGEMETIELSWPDTPEELGEALDPAVGLKIRFDVVNKKSEEYDNHNIYFRECLEGSSPSSSKVKELTSSSDGPTKRDVIKMGKDDNEEGLQIIIDDEALDIKQDDYTTYGEVADLIIKELDL